MLKSKRKIVGYKVFDAYDIADITGSYSVCFEVYKGSKYLGIATFR